MDKLRVGLIVYAVSKPTEGGGHSYYDMLLKGINDFEFDEKIEIINIVFYNTADQLRLKFKKPSIFIRVGHGMKLKVAVKEKSLKHGLPNLTRRHPLINSIVGYILNRRNRRVQKILKQNNIDLVYYLKPEFEALDYPFIATHWDVAHRSLPPFPEVAMNGAYEARERYYLYTLGKAFLILCESESGVQELKKFYSFLSDKIKVLPAFPGNVINEIPTEKYEEDVLSKYQLQKQKFFIYPAQFWALKNHYNLVQAFSKLVSEMVNTELKLVLCGSDKGNLSYIKQVVKSLSLQKQVIFPGFITDAELHVLYKNAVALTMPTFLGPTNLPLLEAAYLNCPVICSNFDGHKELIGDLAIYVDPRDADELKEAMKGLVSEGKSNNLRSSGEEYINQSPFNINNSLRILNDILVEALPVRKTWGR